ncbi:hypothetical protein [Marinococcus sp. PL1-022]|uniref:hypothetical protein n=1 Tax=Marinococcus sp. PL1-022 TaxID=3095363 RepID=UPI002635D023|nr:hypothetical protein [Marinococcus sp. PL1-022]MDX6154226.1 hypothetical protein [Marinococcus sp. PL1-022]
MRKNTEMTEVENVIVHKAAEFQGYTILFSIHGQRFQFLIADGKPLFPLNVLHTFAEKDVCSQCGKKVLQVPVGQQICRALQHRKKELLAYMEEHFLWGPAGHI